MTASLIAIQTTQRSIGYVILAVVILGGIAFVLTQLRIGLRTLFIERRIRLHCGQVGSIRGTPLAFRRSRGPFLALFVLAEVMAQSRAARR